jgi:hypothetical protein
MAPPHTSNWLVFQALTHAGKNGVTTITLRNRFPGAAIRKKLELACAAAPEVAGEISHDNIFARILVTG